MNADKLRMRTTFAGAAGTPLGSSFANVARLFSGRSFGLRVLHWPLEGKTRPRWVQVLPLLRAAPTRGCSGNVEKSVAAGNFVLSKDQEKTTHGYSQRSQSNRTLVGGRD